MSQLELSLRNRHKYYRFLRAGFQSGLICHFIALFPLAFAPARTRFCRLTPVRRTSKTRAVKPRKKYFFLTFRLVKSHYFYYLNFYAVPSFALTQSALFCIKMQILQKLYRNSHRFHLISSGFHLHFI